MKCWVKSEGWSTASLNSEGADNYVLTGLSIDLKGNQEESDWQRSNPTGQWAAQDRPQDEWEHSMERWEWVDTEDQQKLMLEEAQFVTMKSCNGECA